MEEVKLDSWGYEIRTSSDSCISAINNYYHQVLSYGRKRHVILEAPIHDKDCVLANILAANFLCSSNPSKAPSFIEAAKSNLDQATAYEKAVFDVLMYLISDDRDDDVAIELHFKLLKDFPRDLASLKRAQILCFYMGRPDLSLRLVEQVLPENLQENYIYGMLAFALLELGRISEAEETARKGFQINKQDCWTQHNLCHVFQYKCRFQEAIQFMEECSSSWTSCCSFMLTHNWWHVALCYLEGNAPIEKILEIYDNHICKELERSDSHAEVYLNSLGLMLRLHVRGKLDIINDRFKTLMAHFTDQAYWYLEWHLDLLLIWGLAFTGELSKAEDLLKGLKLRFSKMNKKKQQRMQRGITLAEAMYFYGLGNDKQALEVLGLDFDANDCKMVGASDEQLDVFNEVWYILLLNTGHATKAIEVLEKRIKKRGGVPFLWRLLEKAYTLSDKPEAAVAGEKAGMLESAYFRQPV